MRHSLLSLTVLVSCLLATSFGLGDGLRAQDNIKSVATESDRPSKKVLSPATTETTKQAAKTAKPVAYPVEVQPYIKKIIAGCHLGDDADVEKAVTECMAKSTSPLRDSQLILYAVVNTKPFTISHSRAVGENATALAHYAAAESLGKPQCQIDGDRKRIAALLRQYNTVQDNILIGICDSCQSEDEALKLIGDIGKIKRKRPLSERLYCALANLQIRAANLSDASAYISEGLKLYPNSIQLLELRASLHSTLGHKQEAMEELKNVQRRGGRDFTESLLRYQSRDIAAQFASLINDDDQAAREVLDPELKRQREKLKSAKTVSQRSVALVDLAELEITDKNYSDALKLINQANKLNGGTARSYEIASWAWQGLKKYQQASDARRQALTLFSKH